MEYNEMNIEKLMTADINMREKIADLESEIRDIKLKRDEVQNAMHEACKILNVSSLKTEVGTLIRSVKTSYVTNNWPAMYEFIKENDVPEFLHKRLSSTNIKTYLDENPDKCPAGLAPLNEYVVSVRKNKEHK
tara:strand:- start:5233 stop:5631 length:399 start_codon:yes stop_codon:yes gene_type:complete